MLNVHLDKYAWATNITDKRVPESAASVTAQQSADNSEAVDSSEAGNPDSSGKYSYSEEKMVTQPAGCTIGTARTAEYLFSRMAELGQTYESEAYDSVDAMRQGLYEYQHSRWPNAGCNYYPAKKITENGVTTYKFYDYTN